MVIRKIPIYNFENLIFKPIKKGDFLKDKFYISLPILPQCFTEEKTLLLLPGSLEIRVIKRSYNDGSPDNRSINAEGCFYFNEENEWILEAICHMQTDDLTKKQDFIIRLPLSAPFVRNTKIGLYFDGTWIRFMKDGEILNQNSGFDCFCPTESGPIIDETIKDITFSAVQNVNITYKELKSNANADFFFPYGWNTNIGDVMTFTHNGVYHLIYLLDRRHHGSGPCGSHYICQLTSENLIDWYEQKPIVEIDKPWKSCGTGTMFYHNNKYYMSYGLHTERYGNTKEKIAPTFNSENGEFEPLTFDEVFKKGGLPAGGTYSVSDDGINFTPSEFLFHSARNPSAYTNENGKITLYCGYGGDGVFESEDLQTPFRKSAINFDFALHSPMRNTTECPAFFSWNGYKYLIIGFTGYFRTLNTDSNEFVDAAAMGENIYDGLSVPMVTEFGEDRRIIAGWVCSPLGWGGVLMQRELIQEENGKLGMKWIPELLPQPENKNFAENKNILDNKIPLEFGKSYYFNTNIDPENAKKLAIALNNGDSACTVELDFENKTVQINDAILGEFATPIPTILEAMKNVDESVYPYTKSGVTNIHRYAKNYTLPDICGIDKPFTFKMIIRHSKRLRSTVLDAEIAGRRTFISIRNDFFPTEISAFSDGDLTVNNIQLNFFDFEE